MNIHELMN